MTREQDEANEAAANEAAANEAAANEAAANEAAANEAARKQKKAVSIDVTGKSEVASPRKERVEIGMLPSNSSAPSMTLKGFGDDIASIDSILPDEGKGEGNLAGSLDELPKALPKKNPGPREKKDAEKAKQQSSTGASASASTSSSNVRTLPTVERNKAAQPSAGKEDHDRDRDCHFLELPEDVMHQVLCFLPAKDLGAAIMSCQALNAMLAEARVPILISRLNRPNMQLQLCQDQAEARTIIQQSFAGGDTGRILPKRLKINPIPHVAGAANEFVGYVRFVEQAILGHATLGGDANRANPTLLPPCVNGRFASVSLEHSLCRMGGDGSNCGPVGSGVVSWGVGKFGALGHGDRQDQTTPKMIPGIGFSNPIRIVQVSAGGFADWVKMRDGVAHSLLLTSTGRVLSFGTAMYGALGHDYGPDYSPGKHIPDVTHPRYINGLSHVTCTCVSAGGMHSAVTTSDGDVYSWGNNLDGQLGFQVSLGDNDTQLTPQQVTLGGLEDKFVASVACGCQHTICVTDDGKVFTFGRGLFGALGRSSDVDAAGIERFDLDDNSNQCIPMVVDSLKDIKIVGASAGQYHSIVLDSQGGIYTFGSGGMGELGHGAYDSQHYPTKVMELVNKDVKIMQISAGGCTSMAVSTTGDVYAWGKTGIRTTGVHRVIRTPRRVYLDVSHDKPLKAVDVECGTINSIIIGLNGTIHHCGYICSGRPVQVADCNIWHRIPEPIEEIH